MVCKTKLHGIVGIKDFNPRTSTTTSQNIRSKNFYFGMNQKTVDENNAQEILLKM